MLIDNFPSVENRSNMKSPNHVPALVTDQETANTT